MNEILTSDTLRLKNEGRWGRDEPWLMIACLVFLLGVFLGSTVGAGASTYLDSAQLEEYVNGFVAKSFLQRLYDNVVFPALFLALATSTLGFAAAPILLVIKAYSFSCAVASIMSSAADNGIALATVLLFPGAVFFVPCLIFLCVVCMDASFWKFERIILDRPPTRKMRKLFLPICIALLLLFASVVIERFFVPQLIPMVF
jgi:uncharacterized membrane protein SpoIIM required for sporulation